MHAQASTRKWSWVGAVMGVALATMALAPSAFGAVFTVNNTGDDPDAEGTLGNGTCDTVTGDPVVCTLRAAIQEAEDTANPEGDTINFDQSVFTGAVLTSTISVPPGSLEGPLPGITQPTTVDGGDCDPTAAFKPCVGIEAPSNSQGLLVAGNNIVIRGLALTNGVRGILVGSNANAAVIAGNWVGLKLDMTPGGNSEGVRLEGNTNMPITPDNHVIGGETPADRNVFAHNTSDGVRVNGSDDITIKGNYFGVKPDGTTAAPNGGLMGTDNIEVSSVAGTANPANNIMIGGTVSAAQLASPECDGPCNVIANSSDGVDLETEGGSEGSPVSTTTIRGNFIGLNATGQAAAGNTQRGIRASTSDISNRPVIVGGPAAGDRNVISGNGLGGLITAGGATVQNNYFGSNSQGNAAIPNMFSDASVGINEFPLTILVQDNRFVGNGTSGGRLFVKSGNVIGNTFGIGTGGEVLAPAGTAITVEENNGQIGGTDPGEANTVGNVPAADPAILISGGDLNTVQGNLIGVTANGTAVPNGGPGIRITNQSTNTALDNTIGGDLAAEENVISNSGGDAIEIVDDESGGPVDNNGNTVLRNRGATNGSTANDLFIDLLTNIGGNGPGNPVGGPNAGIGEPLLDEPTTTGMTGNGTAGAGSAGNVVRVFKTYAETNDDVRGFAAQATVAGDGSWAATFSPPLPNGQCLSATETDALGNTSELAQPSESIGPDPCDVTGPTITIDSGPSGTTNDPTADFGFSSEAGATFECRVDGAPFAPCDDPTGPTGSDTSAPLMEGPHTFEVRGTDEIGNLGPVASQSFTVDVTAPTTTIDSGPTGTTSDPTADFGFSSEAGVTFQCRVDTAPFGPCTDSSGPTGTHTTAPLVDGPHTFEVQGTDAAGNPGNTASRPFTVDTPDPTPPGVIPPTLIPPTLIAPPTTVTPAKKKCKKKRKRRGTAAAKKKCKKKKRR